MYQSKNCFITFTIAIQKGIESGIVKEFDPAEHLIYLKSQKQFSGSIKNKAIDDLSRIWEYTFEGWSKIKQTTISIIYFQLAMRLLIKN